MRCGLFFAVLLLCACSPDVGEWAEGRPRILAVEFLRHSETLDHALEFSLSFTDSDGNLAGGKLAISLNDESKTALDLAELFAAQTPPLLLNASSGSIEFPVMFDASSSGSGDKLKFDFEISDETGQVSNHVTLRLVAITD